ncbi:MAG: IS200/IS605 family transposase [Treponema sp.]|jgi:REP element-mobilizing transposase RayT|nr:IS200/IS605 family transposase [Treponema sp.]
MSEIIHKEHNVSTLMYHIVCPAKYRRTVITEDVDKELREICLGIEARYEIKFLEIGTERDRVHFLVQSVPTYSPEQIARTIKSITARKIFERCPEVKKMLWGGEFRTRGYYVGSAGEHGDEQAIQRYVKNQGRKAEEYQKIHEGKRLELFPYQNKA